MDKVQIKYDVAVPEKDERITSLSRQVAQLKLEIIALRERNRLKQETIDKTYYLL